MHGMGDEERHRRDHRHRQTAVQSLHPLPHERTSDDQAVAGVSQARDARAAAFTRVVARTVFAVMRGAFARQAPDIAYGFSDRAADERKGDEKCGGAEHVVTFQGNRGAISGIAIFPRNRSLGFS